ncbi:MAG TPA: hypothetical protein VJU86_04355 [Pyrinomonadaceae bacterium]|nr:hypothetical protein [Pyrinomonadaceae bacterium]
MSLRNFALSSSSVIFGLMILVSAGCAPKDTSETPTSANPPAAASNAPAAPGTATAPTAELKVPALPPLPPGKNAAIIAEPNPIRVCDGSGLGRTAIAFTIAPPVEAAEVRVGAVDGGQLASLGRSGHAFTGNWVNDGLVFYLQDITGGKKLTPENTLATLTVNLTKEGCP